MKRLIVTADDFGLTKSVNEGIAKAYREGIVTSLSVLSAGEAFEDALSLIKDMKPEGIGAHLTLTETQALSEPAAVPTLVHGGKRFFKNHKEFLARFFLKMISPDEVYVELKKQMDKLKKARARITNLSSHEYIHMVPGILEIFMRLAREYAVPVMRYPEAERLTGALSARRFYRSCVLSYFSSRVGKALDGAGIAHADHFLGFLDSGRLKENTLMAMLGSLSDGTTELVSHPGFVGPEVVERYRFHVNCEEELFALTSRRVKAALDKSGAKLISHSQFLSER